MLRSRRLALVAAAVISVSGLVITACGDAVDTTGRGLHVFQLGAGGNQAGAESTSAVADGKMMVMAPTDFVFDGEFPDLPSTGPSYLLATDVSISQIEALAAALGVAGDVRELGADMGGGWMVGSADYTGANLTVSADGMGSWWFNPDPSVYGGATVSCGGIAVDPAAPVSTDATIAVPAIDECRQPEPPTGVPSADEALVQAKALLQSWGDDPGRYTFETYADEWSASVTGYLMVDGQKTPVTFSAGFGAEGALTWASGSLVDLQRGADYPLAGVEAGLERLNDDTGAWSYYGYPGMMARSAVTGVAGSDVIVPEPAAVPAGDAPVTTEVVVVSTDTVPVDPALVDPAMPVPMPCDPAADCQIEPVVPMEPVTVHLTDVELGLTMVWDADGTAWLLPAYNFSAADQGPYTVLAVDDEYVETPAVTDATDTTTVGADGSGATGVDVPASEIDLADASAVLTGLDEAEATKVAAERGWEVRVVERDGESLDVTMDYRTNRVNVAVDNGTITSVDSIG